MYKRTSLFPAIILLIAGLFFSCQKTKTNPCEGLMNESPPKIIYVKFIDKQTGDNLIVTNNLDKEDVKVTIAETGEPHHNSGVTSHPGNSPLYGLVGLAVFHEKAGDYPYKIQVGDLGTVTLSYTVDQVKSDDPCKSYYYPLKGIKIVDHPFELLEHEGKTYPNILVVAL